MTLPRPQPRLSVIVPTLGLSRWLEPCLAALREDGGTEIEILLVIDGEPAGGSRCGSADGEGTGAAEALADVVLRSSGNLGFAAVNNFAAVRARGEFLATVNDDAIVQKGWCLSLLEALEARPDVAAVQGVNVGLADDSRIDGAGIAWNRSWQAIQIGHGLPRSVLPVDVTGIFGVSATAAIYRRSSLEEVAGSDFAMFNPRLFAYYEDVELACRLQAAGYQALFVPRAVARHGGSISGDQMAGGRRQWVYGNRHLVLAQLLGRAFWPRLPWILLRDLADLWQAMCRADLEVARGICHGGLRALRHGLSFARLGPPLVPLRQLRRFQK